MIHTCRRCEKSFPGTRAGTLYCSDACKEADNTRICKLCGKTFHVTFGHTRLYCGRKCAGQADREVAIQASATKRRSQRISVPCIWPDCPRPYDLLSLPSSWTKHPSKQRHPECRAAYRLACGGGTKPRKGRVVECKGCGTTIGYRMPSQTGQEYCNLCAHRHLRGKPRPIKSGEWRTCPFETCSNVTYVSPSRAARASVTFCSVAHRFAALESGVIVTCRVCGSVKRYSPSLLPRAMDRATMTWVCTDCRPRKTAVRSFTCAQCHDSFTRRVSLTSSVDDDRFCQASCRKQYYREMRRRANPCQYCGKVIERRGRHKAYCNWDCYIAGKTGQPLPHYHPSKAELRIIAAWTAGARGVRPLARASSASINTVQKLIKAGKIAS